MCERVCLRPLPGQACILTGRSPARYTGACLCYSGDEDYTSCTAVRVSLVYPQANQAIFFWPARKALGVAHSPSTPFPLGPDEGRLEGLAAAVKAHGDGGDLGEAHPPPHHRANSFGASDCATRWSPRRCWRAPHSCYGTCIVGLSPSLLRKGAYKALMGLSASI